MLVFARPGSRRSVGDRFRAATFRMPHKPVQKRNAAGPAPHAARPAMWRWTRRPPVPAPVIAARLGRPAARAGMADRVHVRDLHALLPVFC
ncbi:hypothetical protein [Actinomadura sp. WMMA1423]|uniref:hypothetical protein n=1 Tax=Actinomadura sp. WMMA1423 TaxID=2591108 RepID=UPI0011475E7F|nr:hypothetical protein [Actinomadura sp. WMMA1423]